jgi:hypothetical protein
LQEHTAEQSGLRVEQVGTVVPEVWLTKVQDPRRLQALGQVLELSAHRF